MGILMIWSWEKNGRLDIIWGIKRKSEIKEDSDIIKWLRNEGSEMEVKKSRNRKLSIKLK